MLKLYSFFLKQYPEKDYFKHSQAKLTLHFCLITSIFSLFYTAVANLIGFAISAKIMPVLALLFFGLSLLLRTGLRLNIISFQYLFLSFTASIVLIAKSGMIFSSILPWLAFIPMAANLLMGKRSAFAWLIMSVLAVYVLLYLSPSREAVQIAYSTKYDGFFYAVVNSGLIGIVLLLSMIYQKSKDKYLDLLQDKNAENTNINTELKAKNDEIVAQNEELIQQKEEILAQRELIESRNMELINIQHELNNIIEKLTITQDELGRREAENRSILNAMYGTNLLVAEIDREGQFLKVSPILMQNFGFEQHEIIGKSWDDVVELSNIEFDESIDFKAIWKEIFKGGHHTVEIPIKINGSTRFLKENFFPIIDENGSVKNVMLVGQDITKIQHQKLEIEALNEELTHKIKEIEKQNLMLISQQKEIEKINKEVKQINATLEKRVKKRTKNLEKKNKQLAEYGYINAHLLRGPLCSILGLVNLLESHKDNDYEMIVQHMKKSSDDLHKVVNRISQAIEDGNHLDREFLSQN